ncbi:MAG: hypothetical protein PHQ89_04005 [Bacilli bacterium]|nr:hypothetical protein [Bacilli bacterium]
MSEILYSNVLDVKIKVIIEENNFVNIKCNFDDIKIEQGTTKEAVLKLLTMQVEVVYEDGLKASLNVNWKTDT